MAAAKLDVNQKRDLYALCGVMEDSDRDTSYDEFLLMYLSGDRNWKDDFKAIFGREAGMQPSEKKSSKKSTREKPAKEDAKFDIGKVSQIKINKRD